VDTGFQFHIAHINKQLILTTKNFGNINRR